MPRAFFNVMAEEGAKIADWREAFHYGQAKATGVSQILRLVERVVDMHEERTLRPRRARRTGCWPGARAPSTGGAAEASMRLRELDVG